MTETGAPPPPRPYTPPSGFGQVVFEDDHLLVADKPSGLLSVPGRGEARQDCLQRRLEDLHGPLIAVHRLDMDTSGLIVFARTAVSGSFLSRAFETRAVSKRYQALVHGLPAATRGEIDLPIGRDWSMRPLRKADPEEGQPALTRWSLLADDGALALLELMPETGRTHQLRVHLQAAGHPICGDRLYGRPDGFQTLCLHASQLALPHPETATLVEFSSDADFAQKNG